MSKYSILFFLLVFPQLLYAQRQGSVSYPTKGKVGAPIRLMELTDFECTFCNRVRPTIHLLIKQYPGMIEYVVRSYPLDFHGDAYKASLAALCAHEQGEYWKYAQYLWSNQNHLKTTDLKLYARQTGLNQIRFDQCLDQSKYDLWIKKDVRDAERLGISGTPSYLINNTLVKGAKSLSSFKKIIEEQLQNLIR